MAALSLFHPRIRDWFRQSVGTPTDIQERAWPVIAAGEHVLATAPTGSGKTLCAFLWAIHKLYSREWPAGETRVLYVSPLKALNTDIRINLLRPLAQLGALFGEMAPRIQVHTRSGDTSPEDRRRTQRQHPEIFITTPESLSILLTSAGGESMFRGLTTVILDEIHAVAGTKRGTHLITAVERLCRLSGEIQRIALSATVRPLDAVADLVGGYRMQGDGEAPSYQKRPVTVIVSPAPKQYVIQVRSAPPPTAEDLERAQQPAQGESINPVWPPLVRELRDIIGRNTSTLIFTNSRRHAEKIAYLLNEGQDHQIAYAHHGSLSREVRAEVEQKLKAGELAAIVATSSLELGIDIGELDEVILIQAPFSVASLLQRVGRAGHSVGFASKGTIFPIHGMDYVAAAVTTEAARAGEIEETRPIHAPLDVLAQLIVSLTAREPWRLNALYAFVRTAAPYHDLRREHFDLVVEMLAGRYADTRLRALRPLCSVDRVDGTIRARDGAALLIYFSGGTIPDRGYYTLRTADTKARLGELDEEFVFERSVGDRFMLGTQAWRIQRIDYQNVEVVPSQQGVGMTPFWKAEAFDRSFALSERIGLALETWNEHLDQRDGEDRLRHDLRTTYGLDAEAADRLIVFLREQRDATRAPTPHRHHVVVERIEGALGKTESRQIILHTTWGGRVNRPVALALSAAWQERNASHIECFADNDGVLLLVPHDVATEEILGLLDPDRLRPLLRKSLEASGVFGARFRENAARALLLPRDARKRMPLWLTRQRSKKLLDAVMTSPDFPILLETWKTCLEEELDIESTARVLDEVRSGAIRVTDVSTRSPSPFSSGLAYKQTSVAMYLGDELQGSAVSRLSDDLIRDFLSSTHLTLALAPELIQGLVQKLRRTAPGYTPENAREMLDWVVERLAIPLPEWMELLDAIRRDRGGAPGVPETWIQELGPKLVFHTFPGATVAVAMALETRLRIERALAPEDASDLGAFIAEWMRFSGPFPPARLGEVFGLASPAVDAVVETLRATREIVLDLLVAGGHVPEICDAENLEILLRMRRAAARPTLQARPAAAVPLFLASHQGLCRKGTNAEDLKRTLDRLFGFPASAELWETEILPARLDPYYPAWIDGLMASSTLLWFGCGKQRTTFAFAEDVELYLAVRGTTESQTLDALFPDPRGRYTFWDILDRAVPTQVSGSAELSRRLWDLVWKGRIANDTYDTLRRGIRTRFTADEPLRERGGRTLRVGRDRWQSSRPSAGSWYLLARGGEAERDPVEEMELHKDRIRQLLERYGILWRELTDQELPGLAWRDVFRTLRIMELAGEVTSGLFFHGPLGPQFASFSALRTLEQELPEDAVYWMCASDPASPCGGRVPGLDLPPRLKSTHLVFEGQVLRLVSRRGGRAVDIHAPPDHPRMEEILGVFKHLVGRQVEPQNHVITDTVNGTAAAASEYAPALMRLGFTRDYKRLVLRAAV
jgi:ATP-dependent Lhr-like helicase